VTTAFGQTRLSEQVLQAGTRTQRPVCAGCGIAPGGLSPWMRETTALFGAETSFARAAPLLSRHCPAPVSPSRVRKVTLEAARAAQALQQPPRHLGALPAKGAASVEALADGPLVPVVSIQPGKGDGRKRRRCEWRETRLCAARAQGCATTHYGCDMSEVETLGRAWAACARDAGQGLDSAVHALGEGATWVGAQALANPGPKCRVLVDFYHVSEYLAAVATQLFPGNPGRWRRRQQRLLKKGRHRQVVKTLAALVEPERVPDEPAPARAAHRHLKNRSTQLWYDEALSLGRSIGSGLIEAAHRHVLQHRLKLSGSWWSPSNAAAMSHLRVHLANNRTISALLPFAA
jgi:hypothetical protein